MSNYRRRLLEMSKNIVTNVMFDNISFEDFRITSGTNTDKRSINCTVTTKTPITLLRMKKLVSKALSSNKINSTSGLYFTLGTVTCSEGTSDTTKSSTFILPFTDIYAQYKGSYSLTVALENGNINQNTGITPNNKDVFQTYVYGLDNVVVVNINGNEYKADSTINMNVGDYFAYSVTSSDNLAHIFSGNEYITIENGKIHAVKALSSGDYIGTIKFGSYGDSTHESKIITITINVYRVQLTLSSVKNPKNVEIGSTCTVTASLIKNYRGGTPSSDNSCNISSTWNWSISSGSSYASIESGASTNAVTIKSISSGSVTLKTGVTPADTTQCYINSSDDLISFSSLPYPTYVSPTSKSGITYSGSAQQLITAGSVTEGGTMKYSLDNSTWSSDATSITGTSAGTYTIYWKVEGDSTHTTYISPTTLSVTIGKANAYWSVAPKSVNVTVTGSNIQMVTQGTPVGGTGYYSWSAISNVKSSNASDMVKSSEGTYTVYYTILVDHLNYQWVSSCDGSVNSVITSKSVPTYTPPTAKSGIIYSGSAQQLITAGTVTTGGLMEYSLNNSTWSSDATSIKSTNAGTYTVYWRISETSSYTGVSSTVSCTISKMKVNANVTISISSGSSTLYSGDSVTFTASSDWGGHDSDYLIDGPVESNASDYITWSEPTATFKASGGSITIKASAGSGSDENHYWDSDSDTITITTAEKITYYTVTWIETANDTTLKTQSVASGTVINTLTYPTPPSITGYTFSGWDPAKNSMGTITGDITIVANYTKNTYTVNWVNSITENIITTQTVDYGTKISSLTYPDAPLIEGYTFSSWNPASTSTNTITKNTDIIANYIINTYTVTWKESVNNTTIKTATVNYDTAIYNLSYPTEPTITGYTFSSWDPPYTSADLIRGNTTITANYTKNASTYTVTWLENVNNTTLKTQTGVTSGTVINTLTYPTNPTITGYGFTGWQPDSTSTYTITADTTITAIYTKTYTVTWKENANGTTLKTQTVYNGTVINTLTYPTAPTITGYAFSSWSPASTSTSTITSDTTIYATYNKTPTVTWVENANGTTLKTQTVTSGTLINVLTYPTAPTITGYTFSSWNPASTSTDKITGDTTITAIYTKNASTYTVTWKESANGTTLKTQTVTSGTLINVLTYPTAPTITGYNYMGWNPDSASPDKITADTTITAIYTKTYTVTWLENVNNTTLKTQTGVASGTVINTLTYPDAPTITGYTFSSWNLASTSTSTITSDATIYAVYNPKVYTVTWVNGVTGVNIKSQSVYYNTVINSLTYPTAPSITGYTFSGWSTASTSTDKITSDTTITAVYDETSCTVTWVDGYSEQTITTDYVDYGTKISSLQYPNAPTHSGVTFNSWNPAQNSGGTVTSNITITATYNGA